MIAALQHFVGPALLTLLAYAVWTDVTARRIKNATVLGVLALAPLQLALSDFAQIQAHLLVGGLTFAVLYVCWEFGWIGGGDLKLISAVALIAGPDHIAPFFFWTALAGGVLALYCLVANGAHARLSPVLSQVEHVVSTRIGAWFRRPEAAPAQRAAEDDDAGAVVLANEIPYGVAIAIGGFAMWLTS